MNNSPYHNNEPMFNKTMFSFNNKIQTRITNDSHTWISTPFQKQQQNLLNQRVSQDSIHSFSKKRIYNEMNNWLNSYNISNILITETAVNEYFESIKVSKDIKLNLFDKAFTLKSFLDLFNRKTMADFSKVGLTKYLGKIQKISSNVLSKNELYLLEESVTGLFVKKIKL